MFILMIQFFSCCGAGTAADTTMTTKKTSANLILHGLSTGRIVPVTTANIMLKQFLFQHQVCYILSKSKPI